VAWQMRIAQQISASSGECGLKSGKIFPALGETLKWLGASAVFLVLHEGKTQAEVAQAAGVHRKRDRKIIHSLCLIFTTFVLIFLSVHRTCTGGACLWVNERISWLTYRRGAPFVHTPSISAPQNVRQFVHMAQPDLDASPMRGRPLDRRIHHLRRLGCAVSWEHG
jgi:hypothetical protein